MRSLAVAAVMTFGLTALAGLFAADAKPSDSKKVPPIRAKFVITATVGVAAGGAGGVGFGGAGGANLGIAVGGGAIGGGNAPNLGIVGVAGGAGGKPPAQNLGGGGAFGVLGGGLGFNGAPPKPVPQTDLLLSLGADSGKTLVLATVPNGKATEWTKKYWANSGWVFAKQQPAFAFTGRVTTEDEDKLFPNGAPLINGPVTLELAEKKRLVFVVESVTAVDKFNKDKYPPQGQASVEGRGERARPGRDSGKEARGQDERRQEGQGDRRAGRLGRQPEASGNGRGEGDREEVTVGCHSKNAFTGTAKPGSTSGMASSSPLCITCGSSSFR